MNEIKNNEFVIDEDDMLMEYCGIGGDVVIPDGIKDIFFEAFFGRYSITSVTIPGTIEDIAPFVFEECSSLKKLIIKEGLITIGACAFNNCKSLEIINLPKSLKHICMSSFCNCCSLKEIHYAGSKSDWNLIEKDEDWDKETGNYKIIFIEGN